MERKISQRVIEAGQLVPGFSEVIEDYRKSMLVNGRSYQTFVEYSRRLAILVIHFMKLPEKITETEVMDYLSLLIQNAKSISRSEFKHTIYSMRYYHKMIGVPSNLKLPQIKAERRLPTILSKEECKSLFEKTKNIKHRLILMCIYGGGLRRKELINLKWKHLDVDRKTMLIERSKGNKDRIVPLSEHLLIELMPFMKGTNTSEYIFTGSDKANKMSFSGLKFLMGKAVKRTGIMKERVSLHSLRHSFASHLIEDGLDIVSVKELLGHSRLESTLIYLHVAEQPKKRKLSPLDTLMGTPEGLDLPWLKQKLYEISLKQRKVEKRFVSQLNMFEG